MRMLILGGAGMLGHKLLQIARGHYDTFAALHAPPAAILSPALFDPARIIAPVDAMRFETIEAAIAESRPDVIVNAIGITKVPGADVTSTVHINALLPHQLRDAAVTRGIRLIHVSTDCVFDGARGSYTEDDRPNARDLYGRSKGLGEIDGDGCVTLRTSFIGRELRGHAGLVEWFLSHRGGVVEGYTHAVFSGFSTHALAQVILQIASAPLTLRGIFHASASPIAKYDLLMLLNEAFDAQVDIQPSDRVRIDRTLDSTHLRATIGLHAPDWPTMVAEMAADPTPYDTWRRTA